MKKPQKFLMRVKEQMKKTYLLWIQTKELQYHNKNYTKALLFKKFNIFQKVMILSFPGIIPESFSLILRRFRLIYYDVTANYVNFG